MDTWLTGERSLSVRLPFLDSPNPPFYLAETCLNIFVTHT